MEEISLILCAMEAELRGILNQIEKYEIQTSPYGDLYIFNKGYKKYVMVLGKIGKVSTALYLGILSQHFDIERVFNVGTSGAFTSLLNVGDVVIASGVIYHDVDVTAFNYEEGQVPQCPRIFIPDKNYLAEHKLDNSKYDFKIEQGIVASGDTFITKDHFDALKSGVKNIAICGEMESGAVAQCCYQLDIPFIIIRSISDYVCKNDNAKIMDDNLSLACQNSAKVLLDLI